MHPPRRQQIDLHRNGHLGSRNRDLWFTETETSGTHRKRHLVHRDLYCAETESSGPQRQRPLVHRDRDFWHAVTSSPAPSSSGLSPGCPLSSSCRCPVGVVVPLPALGLPAAPAPAWDGRPGGSHHLSHPSIDPSPVTTHNPDVPHRGNGPRGMGGLLLAYGI